MQDHRDNVAPTLPTELLSFIFRECVSSSTTPFKRPERASTPLNLSWVNSQWRQVALSTPELWTSIALPNARARRTNPNPNPTNGDFEILKMYISRSGNDLPLSFALDYGGIQSEESGSSSTRGSDVGLQEHVAGMHRLTLILDGVRCRWRIVVVRCRALMALNILLASLVLGAPQLECLLVSTTPAVHAIPSSDPAGEDSPEERMLDLAHCPKLTNVVLQSPQLLLNPFLPDDAPLLNLTSLAISTSASQPDAFTWLQSCPRLETLSIQFVDAPPFALPHALPLTMSRLTRFTMMCVSNSDQEPSDPASFLHLLRLPVLRIFELLIDGSLGSDQGWPHTVNLLRRSASDSQHSLGPPIEEIELLGTPMTPSDLVGVLQLVPGLQKLTIDDVLTSDEVLRQLTGPAPSSPVATADPDLTHEPLCPHLETLVLHASSASLPVLASFASSRCCRALHLHEEHRDSDDPLRNESLRRQAGEQERYRTLRTLELVHSYTQLPSVSENFMFLNCQEDGLKIIQHRNVVSRDTPHRDNM